MGATISTMSAEVAAYEAEQNKPVYPMPINQLREKQAEIYSLPYKPLYKQGQDASIYNNLNIKNNTDSNNDNNNNNNVSQSNIHRNTSSTSTTSSTTTSSNNIIASMRPLQYSPTTIRSISQQQPQQCFNTSRTNNITSNDNSRNNNNNMLRAISQPILDNNNNTQQHQHSTKHPLSPSVEKLYRDIHNTTVQHSINTNQHVSHNHNHIHLPLMPLQTTVIQAHYDNNIQQQTHIQSPTITHSTQTSPINSKQNTPNHKTHDNNNDSTTIQIKQPIIQADDDVVKLPVWKMLYAYTHNTIVDNINNIDTINVQHIADIVLSIPHDDIFINELNHKHKLRFERKKLSNLSDKQQLTTEQQNTLTRINTQLSSDSIDIPYDIATELLYVDKELSKLRRIYVPGRITEDMFWYSYFNYTNKQLSTV